MRNARTRGQEAAPHVVGAADDPEDPDEDPDDEPDGVAAVDVEVDELESVLEPPSVEPLELAWGLLLEEL